MRLLLFTILVFCFTNNYSQSISGKLLDNKTKEPIPFATIQFSQTEAVLSNEEGTFQYEITKNKILNDSIVIASLGYKTKRFLLANSLPEVILLEEEVFEIAPVILSTNKMNPADILAEVKKNLIKNYAINYTKSNTFFRETYKQHVKKFDIHLKKSTIDNIDQNLFDTIVAKFPKRITSLLESFGTSYQDNMIDGKIQLTKLMVIQSKQEKTSMKAIQEDFLRALKDNAKPNSYLIIKTGFLRIDKTESIDSITKPRVAKTIKQGEKHRASTQKYRNIEFNKVLKDIVINPDSNVDFLEKSSRYKFTKVGYVELGDELAYVIEFQPKKNAKFKGKLYINTLDFAIVKSVVESAKPIYDKHFNMFGVKNNDLVFKNTNIYTKNKNGKYQIKYIKTALTNAMSIDRPFKIIEKNKIVKGRNTQNKVSLQFQFSIYNDFIKEIVFNNNETITNNAYESVKLNSNYTIGRFNSYNKEFWNGYNIITPEKAIQELKIVD